MTTPESRAVGFSTSNAGYDCVETYADWIALLGQIYGEEEKSNEIIEYGRQVASEISAVTKKFRMRTSRRC